MIDPTLKEFIFASDFDQTLTFNDSGYVLAELVGIPIEEFERKAAGMARLNLVQQGAELAYLLLHDPEFKGRVRKEHLYEVGKRIRLKENIALLYQILDSGIPVFILIFTCFLLRRWKLFSRHWKASFPRSTFSEPNFSTRSRERSQPSPVPPRDTARSLCSINCRLKRRLVLTTLCMSATAALMCM